MPNITLTTETVHSLEQYLTVCSTEENGTHEPILCRVITRYDVNEELRECFDALPATNREWQLICASFSGAEHDNTPNDMAFWLQEFRGVLTNETN